MRRRWLLLLATGLSFACSSTSEAPTFGSAAAAGTSGSTTQAGAGGSATTSPGGTATTLAGAAGSSGGISGNAGVGGTEASSAGRVGSATEAGAAGAGGTDSALQLRITTSNIRFATDEDGINAWPARKALLFQVLEGQAFDSAGLQEALAAQLADFATDMPEYGQIGVGRNDGKTKGEYAAILYLKQRLAVASSGTFWFSDTPEVPGSMSWGNDLPRICTWARFQDLATGRHYYHYNVHLDSDSQPSREKSVVLLAQRMATRAEPAEPVILTGDFNAEPNDLAVTYLLDQQSIDNAKAPFTLQDAWLLLHPADPESRTSHKFKGGATGGGHIDYIMFGSGVSAGSAEITRTHEGDVYPSDHYPVSATLELEP